MTNGWTDIMNQAGDESVGATLVRLAKLAEAVHCAESVEQLRRQYGGGGVAAVPQRTRHADAPVRSSEVRP